MRISGRLAAITAVALLLTGCGSGPVGGPVQRPIAEVAPAAMSTGPVAAVRALVVLRDWDRARARAWADGDARALARLYVDGATAGARDVAMLRSWTRRGLAVHGMSMQVLGVQLETRTPRRIVLVVTDRLVAAYAQGHGRRYALPHDNATTRRVEFRRVVGRWMMASVRPRTDRPRGAS